MFDDLDLPELQARLLEIQSELEEEERHEQQLVTIRAASVMAGVDLDTSEIQNRREFLMTGELPELREPGYYAVILKR